jgi:hypothetical protein
LEPGCRLADRRGRRRAALLAAGPTAVPALTDDAILKPTLDWRIHASEAQKVDAELSYVTGGMSWEASYNLVAPEKGSTMDLVGWITIDNQSGKVFPNAVIKLMAGDVNKIEPNAQGGMAGDYMRAAAQEGAPQVTEKAFDEFHLYSLPLPTTLRDRQQKQVEFVRSMNVKSETLYVYNGASLGQYRGYNPEMIRNQPDYGTVCNKKVWVMREFENSKAKRSRHRAAQGPHALLSPRRRGRPPRVHG